MKILFTVLKPVLLLSCFLVFTSTYAQTPSWSSGYPKILGGTTSIDLNVQADASGSVYYCVFSSPQTALTGVLLKTTALLGVGSSLVKNGSSSIVAGSPTKLSVTGLTQAGTYYVYVITESLAGLMLDAKISITTVTLSKRLQGFTNYTNPSVASSLVYLPESYYKDSNNYPVLIYLNGDDQMSKGAAGNPYGLTSTGLPMVINNGRDIPMIMAAPQGIWAWDNTATDLNSYIEYIKTKYRINTSQIFLTGVSAGGKGVFQYVDVYKTKIRAIVPVSTWPEPTSPSNFTGVPVWSFMGNADTFGGLYNWIASLKSLGGDATLTFYSGAHSPSVWNAVYSGSNGDDIYTWLLSRGQPPPANVAPSVNAGADRSVTLPLAQLQLTGTASDTDGSIASLLWTQTSGPPATLANISTATLTITNLASGTYTFQLTAKDNLGATSSDQVVVTVNAAANIIPVVNAGADQNVTLPLSQLQLTASASDADGTITSTSWTRTAGPAVTMSNTTSATLTLTNLVAGSYTFQFTAVDNNGASASDLVNVIINAAPNVLPVVNAGADQVLTLPLSQFQLTGSATDADGTITSVAWAQTAGTALTLGNASNATVTVTNLVAGTYTFKYSATDNSGASVSDFVNITINPPTIKNSLPVVNAGADFTLTLPISTFQVLGSASDPDGIASLEWSQVSGPISGISGALTTTLNVPAPGYQVYSGTYVYALTAKDNLGNSATDFVTVTILPNPPPVVNAGPDLQFTLPVSSFQVAGSATDADGISFIAWSQVSGPNSGILGANSFTLSVPAPGYQIYAGTYVYALGVKDNFGNYSVDLVTVVVNPATVNVAPVVNAGADQQVTLPLSQLQLTGTSSDSDGTISSVLWTKISGPSVSLASITTNTLTLTALSAGTYIFQFAATDNKGATSSDQISLTVQSAPVVVAREFDVNITWPWNLQGGTWNDFATTSGGAVGNSIVLSDNTKKTSGITLSIIAPFQDGTNNHGVTSALYPNNVMMYYLRSTTTKIGVLQLAGLDPAKQYDFAIMSSNVDVWYPSDTKLTIGSQSVTVNAKGNKTALANFTNMTPNASGTLTITVAPATTNAANNGVINAMILVEHGVLGTGRVGADLVASSEEGLENLAQFSAVYPNPTDDDISVELNSASPFYSLSLFDSRGVQVLSHDVTIVENDAPTIVKISRDAITPGMYILTVRNAQHGVNHIKVIRR